jgi:hypothetical protein
LLRVNANGFHAGEIEHHATFVGAVADDAMASTAHGQRQRLLASEMDGGDDIFHACAAHDQGRMAIEGAIPDPPCGLIVRVLWKKQFSPQARGQRPRRLLRGRLLLRYLCCVHTASSVGIVMSSVLRML